MQSESLAHGVCAAAAFLSAAVTLTVFVFMAALGLPLLQDGQFLRILWGPWSPVHHAYGIRPMILGSFWIALLGLTVAVPLSFH